MNSEFLIIFDCDGVLVDSEPITTRVFNGLLAELGIHQTTQETMEKYLGRTMNACYQMIQQEYNMTIPEHYPQLFLQQCKTEFEKELQPVRGITTVLQTLPYSSCVASSGRYEKMNITLSLTGLIPYFAGRIFSAQDVERGKPAPDIFLYAAKRMNYQPHQCIVVEDSPLGAQAANAANMLCIGYAERTPAERLQQHTPHIITTMQQLLPTIEHCIMLLSQSAPNH